MASTITSKEYNGNGSTKTFTYAFQSYQVEDVKVKVNEVAVTNFTIPNYTASGGTVTFNNTGVNSDVCESDGSPKDTLIVRVYRETDITSGSVGEYEAKATYVAGSSIKAADLNNCAKQALYATFENRDQEIQTAEIRDGAITSDKIKDGTIVNADINASAAIAQSKIALDAELTELATMSSGTASALADLTQTEVQILDGATVTKDELNILDGVTATTAELNYTDGVTSNIQTQLDAKQASDAELTELATMASGTASALADLTQTEVQILDGVTATTAELNYVDGVTSNVQTQLDAKQASDAELTELATMHTDTASALADLTQAEVQILDGATVTTDELNKLDGVTASTANLNIVDGMTKQTTITDQDTSYPTSGAVVDYVAAQIAPIGGLEVIADDESFPNTIPAAGVVISITDAAGLSINSSGVSTNGDTLDNTTVTINGFPSALRGGVGGNADPYVLGAGSGLMVQSTGSSQTYNYHKALIKESDYVNLSDDINDFNNRYRIANSEGDLTGTDDEGDLYFNKGTNKMYVYDGSSWGEVTSTGDFKYLVLSQQGNNNAPSYGSVDTFDLHENTLSGSLASVTSAAQLMVSVNGVIQKPNSGTSTSGLDGFVLTDGHTIKFTANPPANSDIFVVQSGSALAINAPGDSTVTEAKLNLSGGSNGEFLKKDDTAAGGFVWGAVPAGVGGATGVDFNDTVKARWGTDNDIEIYHDSGANKVRTTSGSLDIDGKTVVNIRIDGSANPKVEFAGTKALFHAGYYPEFLGADASNGAYIQLHEDSGATSHKTTIKGANGMAADWTITLPTAAPTANGQALVATTAGVASWDTVSSTTLDGCGYQNDQTISAGTYEIAANKGVHSVGPITVEGTVTVNGNWVVS